MICDCMVKGVSTEEIKYLGKIVEYTKIVGKKKYNYMEVRIENREKLQGRFKPGDYVKVSLESLDLK